MGGMNAGEVASAVAVETVKEGFASEKLTPEVTKSPEAILRYIEKIIIAADQKIKAEAEADPEKEGMGSTIVLAWLFDSAVYGGWCGDSRAYRYNPANGLEQLSHDHSYVQELVDAGKLTPEMAMEHPQSNIITRSLGDIRKEAQPDTRSFPLCTNDVILLCSDGLCGIMHDSEIESVIARNTKDMGECRDALLQASEKKGWTDNVTIALCQITSGGAKATKRKQQAPATVKKKRISTLCLLGAAAVLLLGIAFGGGYYAGKGTSQASAVSRDSINTDTIVSPAIEDLNKKDRENIREKATGRKGDNKQVEKPDSLTKGSITPVEQPREREDTLQNEKINI
jgi:serine/threonine protein phosphatase PrpC